MNRKSPRQRLALTVLSVLCFVFVATAPIFGDRARATDFGNRVDRVWKTQEFVLTNSTWSGNPFDLVARVTFTHAKAVRTTEMFYVGSDTWKFRFTGTRTGVWNFSTSSRVPTST